MGMRAMKVVSGQIGKTHKCLDVAAGCYRRVPRDTAGRQVSRQGGRHVPKKRRGSLGWMSSTHTQETRSQTKGQTS